MLISYNPLVNQLKIFLLLVAAALAYFLQVTSFSSCSKACTNNTRKYGRTYTHLLFKNLTLQAILSLKTGEIFSPTFYS